jgi:EmrB/QacA subfamily drug resistance transporter
MVSSDRRATITAAVVGSAAFAQAFDSSAVTMALPDIARDMSAPVLSLNVIITAYLMGATAALPLCAWAADRAGPRRMFLAALALFGVSALLCGLSNSLALLLAARILEGCAGAMLLPVGRIIVLRSAPKQDFVRALAVMTMPIMLGPVVGPTVGGFIVTELSWRWLFLLNVPFTLLGIILVMMFIEEQPVLRVKLDFVGTLLIVMALLGLTFGLGAVTRADIPPAAVGAIVAGSLLSGLAYIFHARLRPGAVLSLGSFASFPARLSSIGGIFPRMLVSAVPFLLTMLFQVGLGLSAIEAGGLIFASAVGALLSRYCINPLLALLGFRQLLVINGVLLALTVGLCAAFTAKTPHLVILALLFVQGLLRSLQLLLLNIIGYSELTDREFSAASTISSMSQQMAQGVGIAIAVIAVQVTQRLTGTQGTTIQTIAPAFIVVALLSLLSILWFIRLPADAGAAMIVRRTQK